MVASTHQHQHTKYLDVKLKLTPFQWSNFGTPYGINVIWDDYNFAEQTIVGRFYVSMAKSNPNLRKNEADLDRFLECLGNHIITTNAVHGKLQEIKNMGVIWGQRTVSHIGHPYLKAVGNDIDVHLSVKENDLKMIRTKEAVDDVNHTIIDNASKFREWKPFRDERFKPREVYDSSGRRKYEIYTAVLEEVS